VGTVSSSDASVRILARKKSGIEKPADLKGKKIGVKKGLNSNVYADLFLKKYGLSANDVTYKFMDVKEMPKALLEGKIDAYSASTTYFLEGKRLLGDQSVVFSEPGLYFNSNHMIAKRDFISSKRKVVTKALKAILRAERQVAAAPVEAAKLIAVKMNISEQDATDLLKVEKNQLTLSKDTMRSLIDNADWMLKSGTIENKKTMPDFLKIIDSSLLKEVNAQSVTLQQ
jgi:NitT/TauT family transport system substrate-binding protein